MLSFAIELWKATILSQAQSPCIILPQSLHEELAGHFDCTIEPLPTGTVSLLKHLAESLEEMQPDRILFIPPLVGYHNLPKTIQKNVTAQTNLHDLALQTILDHAPDGCLVGILLPASFLFASGSPELRQSLVTQHRLRLILEFDFPADRFDLPDYIAARRLATLVFQIGQAGDERIRLFKCPDIPHRVEATGKQIVDSERQEAILRDLQKLQKSQGKPTSFGMVLQKQPSTSDPWQAYWYQKEFQNTLHELEEYGTLEPLGELFTILRGFQTSEQVNYLVTATNSQRGIPVIEENNILIDSRLNYSETRHRALHKETEPYHLQPNDICLRQSVSDDLRLRAVKIESAQLPLAAHESVLILRPKPDVAIDSDLVAAYLRSGHVIEFLRGQGVANRLYRDSLAGILVPSEDDELKNALTDIRYAADALNSWRNDADGAIEKLFAPKPVQEARSDFINAGRTLHQRARAARQIDELSYRLRAGLPHPLAYRWRLAESSAPDYEGYKNLLETAEVVVCYMANLAMVIARYIGCELQCVADMAAKLSEPNQKGGTTMGEWVNVLRQFNESKSTKAVGMFPGFEIARLLDDDEINHVIQRLSTERNDEAHGRRPESHEITRETQKVKKELLHLLGAVEFLVEYPLRYIVDAQINSITGFTTYTYQDLMGDHPMVAFQNGETETPHIEKGSLYVVDRSKRLHLLRPLLTRNRLPDGRWGTFILDKFNNDNQSCELKSLEFPQTIQDTGQYSAFQKIGLHL